MFTHIALFTFTDSATAEDIQAFSDALTAMVPQVDVLRSYTHGRNLRISDSTWEYGVVAVMDDEEDLPRYLNHPAHLVAGELLKPILAEAARCQL